MGLKLSDYKLIFATVALIGVLLIASPVLAEHLHFPNGEQYSELYLLGPDQTPQSIPLNIATGQNYTVNVGIGDHLGTSAYYVLYVKLRNETNQLPNQTTGTPSSLPQLYEYSSLVQNGENWTAPLTFSVSHISISDNRLVLGSITINNVECNVCKIAEFDQQNDGYYYQLFIELWAYNPISQTFEYQNRFVYFWLNATAATSTT
jgi:hypothetical protein